MILIFFFKKVNKKEKKKKDKGIKSIESEIGSLDKFVTSNIKNITTKNRLKYHDWSRISLKSKLSFRSIHTRPIIENSKKIAKIF